MLCLVPCRGYFLRDDYKPVQLIVILVSNGYHNYIVVVSICGVHNLWWGIIANAPIKILPHLPPCGQTRGQTRGLD